MNQNYIHTITLYNRIRSADSADKKEHWIRTVLHQCFYKSQVSTGFNGTEVSAQNTYIVRIPENGAYLPYGKFLLELEGHFTVSEGDIVIHGECKEEITGESGQTAVQVLNRYKPDAFKVTAFSDNTAHIYGKHYRLGG